MSDARSCAVPWDKAQRNITTAPMKRLVFMTYAILSPTGRLRNANVPPAIALQDQTDDYRSYAVSLLPRGAYHHDHEGAGFGRRSTLAFDRGTEFRRGKIDGTG